MDNYLIETIEYRGYNIEVCQDPEPTRPDEWGNNDVFLVYDHRQFCVEVKGFDPTQIFEHIEETKRYFYDGYHVIPVYAYIHSGVSLSLGKTSYPFNCPWDTSFRGFALVKKEKGWSWRKQKARTIAESLIKEWNQYLSGDVYGYNSEVGGCWGFFGEDERKRMIEEAKGEIDYAIEKKNSETKLSHFEQLKIWIKNHVPFQHRQPLTLIYA